ncbi:MAG: FAD-dependent monooxygenase [Planktomarina sp.]
MKYDVIIVGGGLNGCSLAMALHGVGVKVALIDAQPIETLRRNDFDGRNYAIAAANVRMLQTLGLWKDLDTHAQPMWDIKVTDGQAGQGPSPFWMHFDHAELGAGPLGHLIEDRHLRAVLLDHVTASGLDYRPNCTVTAHEDMGHAVKADLSDGTVIEAQILVGADGRASPTAKRAGMKRTGWGYGQSSLVCAIDHEKPHGGVAHQFFMPAGPLAILPLTGNRSSIVWTEKTQTANAINALPDEQYLDILRPRFGDFLGEISLTGARYTYPLGLVLSHTMTKGRIALAGDSAHGVHPIAGQGMNAGLKDVAALAELITDMHRRGLDLVSALPDYEHWRRFDNASLAMATDGFNRLFSNNNPILRGIRDLGMGAISRLPGLRKGFMKEAAGLTGDLPRLQQGKAL